MFIMCIYRYHVIYRLSEPKAARGIKWKDNTTGRTRR
jgi:hypothetical protein